MNDTGHFLKNVTRDHERFSLAEEHRLLALAHGGDAGARERLILSILPWAVRCAKRYCGPLVSLDDAMEIASLAAVDTVDKHDPARSRLTTAVPWRVRHHVSRHLNDARIITIPAHLSGNKPLTRRLRVKSLDGEVCDAEYGSSRLVYWPPGDRTWVWDAVDQLPDPRHRVVVRCRFLHGMTLQETGRALGVTRERTRQIQVRAMKQLRQMLEHEGEE